MNPDAHEILPGEKPLERLVGEYSFTSIFRTIAFVGDSLSSGEFQVRDPDGTSRYYDMFEYSWGQFIARKNGLTGYNFSRGGMTAKEYMESYAESRGFWRTDKAAQAYVIALGVLDLFYRNIPLGNIHDVHPEDWRKNAQTFAGYYGQIVSRYKEISPDAKFFFLTYLRTPDENRNAISEKMAELLYDLARVFDNAYVCDLYRYAPPSDEAFREKYHLCGHMNPMGYVFAAHLIDSYIDYIIRSNLQDFKTVGFINSGIRYKQ